MCCGTLLQKKRKRKIWSSSEIDFLKERFSSLRLKEIAIKLNRPFRATCVKAHKLGLKKERRWTEEEINFLKNNYSILSLRECGLKLNRTIPAIQSKARILRLTKDKRWTEKEMVWLKNNYSFLSSKDCAQELNKTPHSIEIMAYKLHLTDNKSWTNKEIVQLKKCYRKKKNMLWLSKDICKKIPNRTRLAIELKACRIGCTTNRDLRFRKIFSSLRNNSNFSYIQGVMAGDGSECNSPKLHKYTLALQVTDKDFSDYFYKKLKKWSGLAPRRRRFIPNGDGRKRIYEVILSSRAVLDFLDNNKLNIVDFKEFLKGFYDSEGHVGYYKVKTWFLRRVVVVNTNFNIMEKIEKWLVEQGVRFSSSVRDGKKYDRKNSKTTSIANYNGIKWFYDNIGFRIGRKQRVLEQIIKDGVKFTKSSYPTNPTTHG